MSGLFSFPPVQDTPLRPFLDDLYCLTPDLLFWTSVTTFPPIFSSNSLRFSGVPGSGSSVAIRAARHAASGRVAGQICSVEICPRRTFFS